MKSGQTRSSRFENINLLPCGGDSTLLETLVLWLLPEGFAFYGNAGQPHFVAPPPPSAARSPHCFFQSLFTANSVRAPPCPPHQCDSQVAHRDAPGANK